MFTLNYKLRCILHQEYMNKLSMCEYDEVLRYDEVLGPASENICKLPHHITSNNEGVMCLSRSVSSIIELANKVVGAAMQRHFGRDPRGS